MLALNAYVNRLQDYPADIAYAALRETWIWFPSWAELKEVCDNLISYRKILKIKVNEAIQSVTAKIETEKQQAPNQGPSETQQEWIERLKKQHPGKTLDHILYTMGKEQKNKTK